MKKHGAREKLWELDTGILRIGQYVEALQEKIAELTRKREALLREFPNLPKEDKSAD